MLYIAWDVCHGRWASLDPQDVNFPHTYLPLQMYQMGEVSGGSAFALGFHTQKIPCTHIVWPHKSMDTHTHLHAHLCYTHVYSQRTGWAMVGCCVILSYSRHNNRVEREVQTTQDEGGSRKRFRASPYIYTSTHTHAGVPLSMCPWHACWCACVITPAAIYVRQGGGDPWQGESQELQGLHEGESGWDCLGLFLGVSSEQGKE